MSCGSYKNCNRKKNRELVDLEICSTIITYKGQKAIYSTVRDITQRKRLEEQLRQAEKMSAVGELSSGIAHDFNNVLAVISGYSDLISTSTNNSKLNEYASQIREAVNRAAQSTRDLLTFARRGSGTHSPLDITKTLDSVIKMLSRSVDRKIEIETELDESKKYIITGDEAQVSNAPA